MNPAGNISHRWHNHNTNNNGLNQNNPKTQIKNPQQQKFGTIKINQGDHIKL